VRLAAVRRRYGRGAPVLDGVELELTAGRPVVVLGANGTGKSTLLRIVAGCAAPTSGRVTGRPRAVGYLPADLPASSRMPARAWLAHLAAIRGSDRRVAARGAAALLAQLGFTGAVDEPMVQLSTGNQQKVGLAQALCGDPSLVVLDEPWSGLDEPAAEVLDGLVAACAARVLVADHTGRAARLPRIRVLRLHAGRLVDEPPRAGPEVVITLRCPADPATVAAALPHAGQWRSAGAVLTVRLPAARGDALLAAALARGCSVLGVRRDA